MESILQSPLWADAQRALGRTVHTEQGPGWSFLGIEERHPLGTVLYLPYGPVAQNLPALDAALKAARSIAKNRGAAFIRIEPVTLDLPVEQARRALRQRGLQPAPAAQQPELSRIIDLDQDFAQVLKQMKPANRNLYRNIGKKGVSFRATQDPAEITTLLGFLRQTAQRQGFTPHSDDYLRRIGSELMRHGAATLYLAELHDAPELPDRVQTDSRAVPIAAALVYDSADTRTYAHAAIDADHRKLSAGIPLVVTLMAEAQKKGLAHVDLWGVAPEDQPEHRWAGFTAFKASFGGRLVEYPGTWDLPVRRLRYRLYTTARALRGRLRPLLRSVKR
ncbi:peptidoglycan bridge formation glycyltransferase FemA/FemB family protein [Acaricomes phytoseiuli]|uniref:lipid II:glycine glycyltransferase FemX n=1 Tax=Acaricomes phytoseiuli TaxID=291968 RepID=UPI002221CF49|nr:peptidoglycan bridge formation glycyltransferase FemA/FemB family protein [Acaricomes phytoseiuli]MCW1250016.1 peptidoglycan bridge formation glycyltransferase FemA/FemB family protein [Acaricomes phytoseiuli]